MKFSEAMDKLKSGSKVSRHSWKEGIYFMIYRGEVKSFEPRFSPYIYNEDIMISSGWLIDNVDDELTFCELMPFLQQGCKAKLKTWTDEFIYLNENNTELVIQSMGMFPFMPDFNSFIAEDWVEVA